MMNRLVRAAIVALLLAPFFLMLMVAGVFFLWENPWLLKWSWIPFPVCWALAYVVFRLWKRKGPVLWQPERDVAMHWTDRDEQAWAKVKVWADKAGSIDYQRFFTSELYITSAQEMAEELAQHYHARSNDPLGGVTVPEVLTAIELAVSDLREFVEHHVPASHLVTIQWLQRASRIPSAWKKFRLAYDAVSLLWNPWGVLYRTASNRTVAQPMVGELERDAMAAVYQAYVLSVGKYLIELNSRRLKVGPQRWRKWMEPERSPTPEAAAGAGDAPSEPTAPLELRIAVVGQVKTGKSSLINALLGERKAIVDLLPSTRHVQRYQLVHESTNNSLVLLDTPGYAGPSAGESRAEAMRSSCDAAIVVLVLHACQPARDPDKALLRELHQWFSDHPDRKRPVVLAAITHVDQLPPSLEWEPPYDGWLRENPERPKDQSIREVLDVVRETLGDSVQGIVPLCTDADRGRVYGVEEWLLPGLLGVLPQAEGKALVDNLHAELDAGRARQVLQQLWNASSLLLRHGLTASVGPLRPDS